MNSKKERAVLLAEALLETGGTVRSVARTFQVSKSTVHKDLTARLQQINPGLYQSVRKLLEINKQERHLRGGSATKEKYARDRKQKELSTKER